jgi:uncharacterized repeat protein (TIGR02543 family)
MFKKISSVLIFVFIFLFFSCEDTGRMVERMITISQTVKEFNVFFDANGGSGKMEAVKYQLGVPDTLPEVLFTAPTGLKFGSWNTKADGSGKSYKNCDLFVIDTGDVKLYAIWIEKDAHSIYYYNLNGVENNNQLSYLESQNVIIENLSKPGYVFDGWYFEADFSGTPVTGWSAGTYTETVRLYAKWTQLYTINFNANGGTGTMSAITVRGDELSTTSLPENTFVRDGFIFDGWNTATDASGITIADGAYANVVAATGSNDTLYAKWMRLYTVSFNANGASGTMASLTVRGDELAGKTLPVNTFVWTDHLLKKWNTAHDGSGLDFEKDALLSDVFALGTNVTLYGVWVDYFDLSAHSINELQNYLASIIDTTSTDNEVIISGVSLTNSDLHILSNAIKAYNENIGKLDLSELQITEFFNSGSGSGGNGIFQRLTALKEVILPKTLITVSEGAFSYCPELEKVTLFEGLKTILWDGFSHCPKLKSITIPDSVVLIDQAAFYMDYELEEVIITKNSQLETIGLHAFYACTSLGTFYVPVKVKALNNIATEVTTYYNGESNVTRYGAFYGCTSLQSIQFENTLTRINGYTFERCTGLTDVYYAGTEDEWDKIDIEQTGNTTLLSATKHYNYTE